MNILERCGNDDVAWVYVADAGDGRLVEFVESVQPPIPRHEKWVLIVSTLFGCPVGCAMCDAGGSYEGRLSKSDMMAQIHHMVSRRYPDMRVPANKFKIQFARMGEPALNPMVLEVLDDLPGLYHAPGLIPSVSTVAPSSAGDFFNKLTDIKDTHYGKGHFQLQFSLHSTSEKERDKMIPVKKWTMQDIAEYGKGFRRTGDRKVTLNFAVTEGVSIDPDVLAGIFEPKDFILKLTPLNPTVRGKEGSLMPGFDPEKPDTANPLVNSLEAAGFDVLLSIGELEENNIGSNCGQYVQRIRERKTEQSRQSPIL